MGPTSSTRPTLIIGMHRSGTSAAAALVRALGVDFGPDGELLDPHPLDNPLGYNERKAIHALNVDILGALGGSWWNPPELGPGWELSPRLDGVRERAERLIEGIASARRWGIKDPTMSLTLPFWSSLLGPADVIVCVRDPREVAASLLRRYAEYTPGTPAASLSARDWAKLWELYTKSALAHTERGRRLVITYSALLEAPAREARRLSAFLALGPTVRGPAADVIDRQLHRERTSRKRGSRMLDQRVGLVRLARYALLLRTEARATPRPSAPNQTPLPRLS